MRHGCYEYRTGATLQVRASQNAMKTSQRASVSFGVLLSGSSRDLVPGSLLWWIVLRPWSCSDDQDETEGCSSSYDHSTVFHNLQALN